MVLLRWSWKDGISKLCKMLIMPFSMSFSTKQIIDKKQLHCTKLDLSLFLLSFLLVKERDLVATVGHMECFLRTR